MSGQILTLNAGSSSLKAALYPAAGGPAWLRGQVEGIGTAPRLRLGGPGAPDIPDAPEDIGAGDPGHGGALAAILARVVARHPGVEVVAVAHRIVHGGPDRDDSVALSDAILDDLARLEPYAPLHQPHNIAGVHAARATFPAALQVAAFDTAFHRGHPWVNDTFALPRRFYDRGVRRYGFHGLNYDHVAGWLAAHLPDLHAGRVVVAHLGNGASMCALKGGRSVASSMGFSALDGLPMGTRSGQLDPGVVLHLMQHDGMDANAITDLLYKKSGLLGLSGLSHDMRVLEAAGTPEAEAAIAYFVFRVRRELGAMAAALSGLDGVIFTGGIGENSARIRAEVCAGLDWLGIALDADRNAAGGPEISGPSSRVWVGAVRADEEAVLARAARAHLPP